MYLSYDYEIKLLFIFGCPGRMGWFLLTCLSLGLNTTNLYSYIRCRMHQRDADKVWDKSILELS